MAWLIGLLYYRVRYLMVLNKAFNHFPISVEMIAI
nr:MAG TPA: hypothetical protein [Caudoviricetes sp.]